MFPAASPEAVAPNNRAVDIPALVVVGTYAALQIVLAIQHDPWLDEAQAWLWATAPLEHWLDFFVIPGEGHPPLWHWLLRALSGVLSFSQARYLSLAVAILNAFLLARLLRGELLLLFLMLGGFAVMQFWGYHFRPYGLVFTCIISALLLERGGRPVAGTWAMAIACALHFFAGLLLALWLVWQWRRGTSLLRLLPPAAFAGLFGLLAVLSASGNAAIGPETGSATGSIFYNLGWIGVTEPLRGPLIAVFTLIALTIGLRHQPVILLALLALLLAFSTGTALIYGKYPWHAAFQTMLCFLAFMLVGIDATRRWILALLLVPQFFYGVAAVNERLAHPAGGEDVLYAIVSADAGAGFQPHTDLVAWPDLAGPAMAAVEGIQLLDGNSGSLLGPVEWRSHDPGAMAPLLLGTQRYWLICIGCKDVLDYLEANGRTLTLLGSRHNVDNGEFFAYRVE